MNYRALLYLTVCTLFFWGTNAQGYTIVWDVVSNPITAQAFALGDTVDDQDSRMALFHVQKENDTEADTFEVTLSVSYEYELINNAPGSGSIAIASLSGEQSGVGNNIGDWVRFDLIDDGRNTGIGDLEVTFFGDVHTDMWAYTFADVSATTLSGVEDFEGAFAEVTMTAVTVSVEGSEMAPVPEPATMLLFGTGLAGLAGYRKRKAMKK